MVHVDLCNGSSWRGAAIRRVLRRGVLHYVEHLDGPVLLRLRFPLPSVRHSGCDMCRGIHGALLLPAVRGGLQLVVEVIDLGGVYGRVRLRLLLLLLLPIRRKHGGDVPPLLWLHVHHLIGYILTHR